VPLLPFLFAREGPKVEIACALAAVGLFAIGALLSLFSGKNALIGGLRMTALGAAAGTATYAIGSWIGVSVS
jgi:VIT1/CCC1 family predicted Fe2+/Mn2+ transporter